VLHTSSTVYFSDERPCQCLSVYPSLRICLMSILHIWATYPLPSLTTHITCDFHFIFLSNGKYSKEITLCGTVLPHCFFIKSIRGQIFKFFTESPSSKCVDYLKANICLVSSTHSVIFCGITVWKLFSWKNAKRKRANGSLKEYSSGLFRQLH
jgi:hypothetical protein